MQRENLAMELQAIDLDQVKNTCTLPPSWQTLEEIDFHPDLTDRAYAYAGWLKQKEVPVWQTNGDIFLDALAQGFIEPFNPIKFRVDPDDPYFSLKQNALSAVKEMSDTFGNRVSVVVWNAFAHLATREEPEEKRSILKERDLLPHHYGIVDTALHAAGKVYTFMLHCQSVFFKHTGMILVHNCDCSCSLVNLKPIKGGVEFAIQNEQDFFEATQSLFTHLLAESQLLINEKLPFEFSITKEAQELLGMEACRVN